MLTKGTNANATDEAYSSGIRREVWATAYAISKSQGDVITESYWYWETTKTRAGRPGQDASIGAQEILWCEQWHYVNQHSNVGDGIFNHRLDLTSNREDHEPQEARHGSPPEAWCHPALVSLPHSSGSPRVWVPWSYREWNGTRRLEKCSFCCRRWSTCYFWAGLSDSSTTTFRYF